MRRGGYRPRRRPVRRMTCVHAHAGTARAPEPCADLRPGPPFLREDAPGNLVLVRVTGPPLTTAAGSEGSM